MKSAHYRCSPMLPGLVKRLGVLRKRRAFEVHVCIEGKIEHLNDYCRKNNLSSCIVGVSGGIDSAVALALANKAAKVYGSPIRRILAASIPAFKTEGATNQEIALSRGKEVAETLGVEHLVLNLSDSVSTLRRSIESGAKISGNDWAAGQLVSYLRTPALYYLATLLSKDGLPAIVVGTTNRDEGAYLGFFGKASDGMVDLQLISDLHKSEVRALALQLGIPKSVCNAEPTGDVYDGSTHIEMIGAPYDFVELYTYYLNLPKDLAADFLSDFSDAERAQFDEWASRIEAMHRQNLHKYIGGSPSVHLDVYERGVKGGWRVETTQVHPAGRKLVNEFSLSEASVMRVRQAPKTIIDRENLLDFGDSAFLLRNVLPKNLCDELVCEVNKQCLVPVGINGRLSGFDPERDQIGSYRATAYNEEIADLIWNRVSNYLPLVRLMNEFTPTDHDEQKVWRAVGINPALRFIVYRSGGYLIPHYDAAFDFNDGRRRTLMSVVLYLTEGDIKFGGNTRLLLEQQRHLPVKERKFDDWSKMPNPNDVLCGIQPALGTALIMDHRVLHDVDVWTGENDRVVLRTDIIFERCGWQPIDITNLASGTPPEALCSDVAVSWTAPRKEVDAAFKEAVTKSSGENLTKIKIAWKVRRDPFYCSVFRALGNIEETFRAGFFDDTGDPLTDADVRNDSKWIVTPLYKITQRLKHAPDHAPLAVLLSTGAFSPIHQGHLEMMETAKAELERKGTYVLGGYISPSHDEYVVRKCGPDTPRAAKRIEVCRAMLKESAWLMIDPWEALHTDRAVNFSDVIMRLENYLSANIRTQRPIEVVFVMGGDNARFALTFAKRGKCICIGRQGYERTMREIMEHPHTQKNPRIIMLDSASTREISSTSLRSNTAKKSKKDTAPSVVELMLRQEGDWAIEPWCSSRGPEQLREQYHLFAKSIKDALSRACAHFETDNVKIEIVDVQDQRREVLKWRNGHRLLSIDPCIVGDYNLGVSRLFELVESVRQPRLVERPGWSPLEQQVKALPCGDYSLLDDDSATNITIGEIQRLLLGRCNVTQIVHSLSVKPQDAPNRAEQNGHLSDVGDLRDFLLGARDGGLVVPLPTGKLVRVPYALPYVRPSDRMSLPVESELEFSRDVWRANLCFFEAIHPELVCSEMFPAAIEFLNYLGFTSNGTIKDVCKWHLERLKA